MNFSFTLRPLFDNFLIEENIIMINAVCARKPTISIYSSSRFRGACPRYQNGSAYKQVMLPQGTAPGVSCHPRLRMETKVKMIPVVKKPGHYLGTEINERWWHRYWRDGLFARGNGEYWFENSTLFFRRHLTDTPIEISFSDVLEIKVGKWHSGKWAGGAPVVKIVWQKNAGRLSSGFIFSRDTRKTESLIQEIKSHIQAKDFKHQV